MRHSHLRDCDDTMWKRPLIITYAMHDGQMERMMFLPMLVWQWDWWRNNYKNTHDKFSTHLMKCLIKHLFRPKSCPFQFHHTPHLYPSGLCMYHISTEIFSFPEIFNNSYMRRHSSQFEQHNLEHTTLWNSPVIWDVMTSFVTSVVILMKSNVLIPLIDRRFAKIWRRQQQNIKTKNNSLQPAICVFFCIDYDWWGWAFS